MRKHPFAGACGALFIVSLMSGLAHAEPSARDIMEKVTVTRKLDGSEAVVKMTSVDEKGQTREREITMATKLVDGGKTEKRIYRFLSPADVQGTGILVFDYEDKPDDVWIYLPALRKTRRIVSSQPLARLFHPLLVKEKARVAFRKLLFPFFAFGLERLQHVLPLNKGPRRVSLGNLRCQQNSSAYRMPKW